MTTSNSTNGHFEIERRGAHYLLIAKSCRAVENGRWLFELAPVSRWLPAHSAITNLLNEFLDIRPRTFSGLIIHAAKRVHFFFSQEPAGPLYQKYLSKIDDVALYIQGLLEVMDKHAGDDPGKSSAKEKGKIVYLAETTSDLSDERDRVMRELRDRGFQVLFKFRLEHFAEIVNIAEKL